MALERSFDISIDDAAARAMITPGDIVTHLVERTGLPRAEVEVRVREIILEEQGLKAFKWTDRLVKDLGIN